MAAALLFVSTATTLCAFPPAPYHTVFGMVRDETGRVINIDGAAVVFYRNGVEVMRQTISNAESRPDQNYQFRLRMDQQRAGTRTYSSLANSTGATFSLAILINDVPHYPIGVSAPLTVGPPGERVRVDLTLGIDTDGDGIPDAWEQSQLYAAGISPGPNGWDLSLLDRNGDFDGDGRSNWEEYIAGTFATDPTDYLELQITAKFPASVRLTLFAIHGKIYSLESSTDLQNWIPVPLYLSNPAPHSDNADAGAGEQTETEASHASDLYNPASPPAALTSVRATTTNFLHLYATASGERIFYRLKVR